VIVVKCKQGGETWRKHRLGIPTASNFEKIVTRSGRPSSQADRYMRQLLAEYFTGEPHDSGAGKFMQRGTAMEDAARAWYRYERGVEVEEIGLALTDDRMIGASPDGLVGDDLLVEIKCPSAATQVEYLLGGTDGAYWTQCQGQMYVTGRAAVDLVAYSPSLPPVVTRVERDESYCDLLDGALRAFVNAMREERKKLEALGCKPAGLRLSMADIVEDPW
jgi:putative phage-type endonuclease